MKFFGIDWVGVNAENIRKLVISVAFILIVLALSALLRAIIGFLIRKTGDANIQKRFWMRQGVSLIATIVLILGLLSIWFNDPGRLATALGLMSAGLAFALQQPVSAIAGYFVILRGSTFTIGDRISMGGVRGDVIRLGFI
ncbi:MAG: mechanosensitive ion channel, partial [Sphingobacteriaceae bacterium]